MTPYDPYDLLGVTSPNGGKVTRSAPHAGRPALEPVAVVHRIELTDDGWGWRGIPPEPGNTVLIDTGAASMLDYHHYEQIVQLVGGYPRIVVVGSGEGAASVARCLEQAREQLKQQGAA